MPALVLLHAFPLDGTMWEREVRALADVASPVIAPNVPGFGGTSVPKTQPTLDDYADAVAAAMDEAKVERAAVAGLSMGGYVAFALWRKHRPRIERLALIDTKAEADAPEAAANRVRLAATLREHGVEALLKTPPKWLRDESPHWDRLKAMTRAQDKEAVAQASVAMSTRADSTKDLASIDVPTAVIVGEADVITPLANAKTMAESIEGASLSVLPDAGHISNIEAPEAFDKAIRAWLTRRS
ncbi:MAG TPA: alpha/beta fold hydrolase [Candidatus Limnocylindrales bacterium]|nr:alpha/beta fold hydrolase [Candidatus Limnocylindrales bacterium]